AQDTPPLTRWGPRRRKHPPLSRRASAGKAWMAGQGHEPPAPSVLEEDQSACGRPARVPDAVPLRNRPMKIRPRRSTLYMPGAKARALEKAKTLPCDAVILDLEDAVAPDDKATARAQVMAAVAARGFGAREVIVRINGLDTAWWLDDLKAAAKADPDGLL